MANDGAKKWVAPYFANTDAWSAEVHLLNLCPNDANVTVTFFDQWGVLFAASTEVISPSNEMWFVTHKYEHTNGWVRVVSDEIVYPWGVTNPATWEPDKWVNMTFYRAEDVEIKEWVRVPAEVVAASDAATKRSAPADKRSGRRSR